jgi:Na+-translocating ferredoxin:NAD+ oxidoreductase subunit E
MIVEELKRGIIRENPVFCLALGLCPVLAIGTSAVNAVGMGVAVIISLTCSNILISLLRKWIPEKVRTPSYIIIIAVIVSVVDLLMKAYDADVSSRLGIYVPLIAVNCLLLRRGQTFALKNNAVKSAVDGVVMGLGFAGALFVVAAVREFLGNNTLFGLTVVPGFHPLSVFSYAPGGFFVLAAILWIANRRRMKKETDTQ